MAKKQKKMMKPNAVEVAAQPMSEQTFRREPKRSESFFSVYANEVQVQTSPWDTRLVFGELGDMTFGDAPVLNIKQVGELRISLPLAKKLIEILKQQILSYEEKFGAVPFITD